LQALPNDREYAKPGRQMTVFFFLFNAAQWLIVTFEIEKVHTNIIEADFYGFVSWTIIQRVTIPMAIFFHFHSAVVFIELFKEVFASEQGDDEGEGDEVDVGKAGNETEVSQESRL
jgi:hypothetical protein